MTALEHFFWYTYVLDTNYWMGSSYQLYNNVILQKYVSNKISNPFETEEIVYARACICGHAILDPLWIYVDSRFRTIVRIHDAMFMNYSWNVHMTSSWTAHHTSSWTVEEYFMRLQSFMNRSWSVHEPTSRIVEEHSNNLYI